MERYTASPIDLAGRTAYTTGEGDIREKENRMSDYRRITRECALERLRPELVRAIRAHAQQHQLGDIEAEVLMCCETTAEKISSGRLDTVLSGNTDTITYLALLVTPQRLVWARSGDRSATVAASAKLKELRVKVFRPKLTEDIGLEVHGHVEGTRTPVGGQLVMGPELAARKFCEEIKQAMDTVSPPRKGIRPRRSGG